jgi:hypothetical protein
VLGWTRKPLFTSVPGADASAVLGGEGAVCCAQGRRRCGQLLEYRRPQPRPGGRRAGCGGAANAAEGPVQPGRGGRRAPSSLRATSRFLEPSLHRLHPETSRFAGSGSAFFRMQGEEKGAARAPRSVLTSAPPLLPHPAPGSLLPLHAVTARFTRLRLRATASPPVGSSSHDQVSRAALRTARRAGAARAGPCLPCNPQGRLLIQTAPLAAPRPGGFRRQHSRARSSGAPAVDISMQARSPLARRCRACINRTHPSNLLARAHGAPLLPAARWPPPRLLPPPRRRRSSLSCSLG